MVGQTPPSDKGGGWEGVVYHDVEPHPNPLPKLGEGIFVE